MEQIKRKALHPLKFLQPSQWESWLRKASDPDWYEHRYRDAKDSALVAFTRELECVLSSLTTETARADAAEALVLEQAKGAADQARRNIALQEQVDKLKLALSLNCELHGCDSELCTAEEYHRDADKLLAERAALQGQVERLTLELENYKK